MQSPIYLDFNATMPILPEVADAVREAALRYPANPDSTHTPGREARRAVEDAREAVAELLGAKTGGMDADQVVFTSGGTEANNLALLGMTPGTSGQLILSAIEHPCVSAAADALAARGWQVDRVSPNSSGQIELAQFQSQLGPATRFVTVMLASNETGVLQPVQEVAAACADQPILVHTDAAQAVGKVPVDFTELGVHSLSIAPHKFGGPLGIGALVLKHGVQLQTLLLGGHQQSGLRPGTQTVALAIGMKTALEIALQDLAVRLEELAQLRDAFERTITAEIPSAVVIGSAAPRLPNTSNIAFVGADRQALVMALDLEGIACSAGSACASGSLEPSATLVAMGLPKEQIDGAVRFSLGHPTTPAEVAEATRRIVKVCKQLQLA